MKRHLFSDPIYGLIEISSPLLLRLINDVWMQRLRRISQLGFTHYVYPGATHTRFSHAMGALHLTQQALRNLKLQRVRITAEEAEATCAAILLHDIGHAPFSHSLEYALIDMHHEEFSLALMQALNGELGGSLELAIQIFNGEYSKDFLHQLVSSQLDMDRLDYLTRDSFFTGVNEGVVGYDRILKMLEVQDGELILNGKGIYSIENFLMARRAMYWQVYLHKTVIGMGELLLRLLRRARRKIADGMELPLYPSLRFFLEDERTRADFDARPDWVVAHYTCLDDMDIWAAIKIFAEADDFVMRYLAQAILSRVVLKMEWLDAPASPERIRQEQQRIQKQLKISEEEAAELVFTGVATNRAYQLGDKEIKVRLKNGSLMPISQWQEQPISTQEVAKYFLGVPR